jgi:protein O-GlcNAc transferase
MTTLQLQTLIATAREHACRGDHTRAIEEFRQVLSRKPDDAPIHFATGNELRHIGDFPAAAKHYEKAIALDPDYFGAYCNLGAALRELHQTEKALSCFKQAVALQPDSVEALYNCAMAYSDAGQLDKAHECLTAALNLRPDMEILLVQAANFYLRQQRIDNAITVLTRALAKAPGSVEILNGLGNCAMAQSNLEQAKEFYQQALKIKPDFADAHYNMGVLFRQWHRLDEAVKSFSRAIEFKPSHTAPKVNLAETLQLMGETDDSEEVLKNVLVNDPVNATAQQALLVSMNYNPRYRYINVINAHLEWADALDSKIDNRTWPNDPAPDRRLKIGYLSPDFCNHPAAHFLEPIVAGHHRDQFEVFCYAQITRDDFRTERFKKISDHWDVINTLNDDEVINHIGIDGIDILVDTAGHLSGNRIGVFARKAAPLQISGIGYPCSTGLKTMDYRITDFILNPPTIPDVTPEQPLAIEPSFCCYQPPDELPPVSSSPMEKNGYVTFGSLHTTARLNEGVITLWTKLLNSLPDSRLVICRTTLTPSVIARLSGWFSRENVNLSRITFCNQLPEEGHLTVYNQIDISLDTFPWSGHTTACESLIMGVPVLTVNGDRPAARMVQSVLNGAGLSRCIASSEDELPETAAALIKDDTSLSEVRSSLRETVLSSALCDTDKYIATLENAYRTVWEDWCMRQ